MPSLVFPPAVAVQDEVLELADDSSAVYRPSQAPGTAQIVDLGGMPRFRVRRSVRVLDGYERANMFAFLANCRGRGLPFWSRLHYEPRGSFPITQAFSNTDFSDGTTGWTTSADASLRVSDRVAIATAIAATSNVDLLKSSSPASVTQYGLYGGGFAAQSPAALAALTLRLRNSGGTDLGALTTTEAAASVVAFGSLTPLVASVHANINASLVGQVLPFATSIPLISLARCAQVDARQNWFAWSGTTTNAAWGKTGCSAATGAFTGPDGTATGNKITEDSSTGFHVIDQDVVKGATAGDWMVAGAFRKGDASNLRDRVCLELGDGASNYASAYFDLANGTVVSSSVAGTVTDQRTAITALGGGWYHCALIAAVPASVATLNCLAYLVQSGTTISYAGNGAANLGTWGLTAANVSHPSALLDATTALTYSTGYGPKTGNALYVRGLPVSTNGLLLPGDFVQVQRELKLVTAPLDSDASGRGLLSFAPSIHHPASDGAPVLIARPMGQWLLAGQPSVANLFGRYADIEFEMESVSLAA